LPPVGGAEGLGIRLDIALDGLGQEIAGEADRAFVSIPESDEVVRLDTGNDEPVWRATLSGEPGDVVRSGGLLWASVPESNSIASIDMDTGEVEEYSLAPYTAPSRIHVGALALRAVVEEGVAKLDLETFETDLLYDQPVVDIAFGAHAFWVLGEDRKIRGIDPNTGADVAGLELYPAAFDGSEITYLRGALWYGTAGRIELKRIDESTGVLDERVILPGGYVDIDAGDEGLWVLVRRDVGGSIHQLNEAGDGFTGAPFGLDTAPRDLSVNEGGLWVTLDDGRVLNIDD
jgi:streptogramin lyase